MRFIRTGAPIEVSSWEYEDMPVFDRYGNIRRWEKVMVPREYKELPYEPPQAEPIDWNDTVPFGVDVKKELEEIRRMRCK